MGTDDSSGLRHSFADNRSVDRRRLRGIKRAVGIQARRIATIRMEVDPCELHADDDLAVGLHCNFADPSTCTGTGIERRVRRTVCIQSSNTNPGCAVDAGERAADQDLPIRPRGDPVDSSA